jgi:PAS domain S-box-containing protein
MANKNLLKILFVEDLPSDVDLAILELRKEGLKFENKRVDTRKEFIKALKEFNPDIIISDYSMPTYNGMMALIDAREHDILLPFILCTGSINEETAVECIKAGAVDYVIKEHITRLPFAIKEALEQHRVKIEKRASDLLLKESEEKLQSIFCVAPVGIGLVVNRVFMEVNDTFCQMTGYSRKELIGKNSVLIYATKEEYESDGGEKYRQISEKGTGTVETRFKCKTGKILNILLSSAPLDKDDLTKGVTFTVMDITERKRVEEALLERDRQLSSIYDAVGDVIYHLEVESDGNYRFISVNQAFYNITGLSKERVIGKLVNEVIPQPSLSMVLEKYRQAINKNSIIRWEEVSDYPTGCLTGDVSIAPVIDDNGRCTHLVGSVHDITKRKRAEEALKESQHLFQTLSWVSPVGIFRTNTDGRTTYVNPMYSELTGLSSEEALGDGWLNAVHPDDKENLKKSWVSNSQSRKISNSEYRFLRPDGSIVWVMGNAEPEWIDNEIVGYVGTITDITERKRAEDSLRESEGKYRRIFENVQDLYYETSLEGTILEVSPSIEILSKGQYLRDELIGKSIFDFYSDPKERAVLISQIKERGTISDFEITLKNRNGSLIPCSLSSKICFDSQGRPEKIIGSMRDITDRKNVTESLKLAKEKAEAGDKLKTTFLNNISHEVRTPLNGILGFAEIMSQADLSEEEKKVSLSMLFESSDRLLNTITNYMDISLITSGNMTLYKKDFSPEQVLRELFAKNEVKCSARNLELLLKLPEQTEKLSVYSDPEIINKIISHLLNNAIKFTDKGSIQYGYAIRKNELEFFVKDTGIGIGKESLNSVFEYFVKEDRGPLKLTEGSGLGLSISKGLVELLGGKIWVESDKGKGSGFFFTIPVEKEFKNQNLSQTTDKIEKNKLTGSILVAEDDEINFFYLKTLIKQFTSADIIHAVNGKEAVDKFIQNRNISLILMDIKMPVMDGLEATRQIKAINRNVQIIAITAYAMAGDEARILDAGCDYYMTKPLNKKLLLSRMAEYISL